MAKRRGFNAAQKARVGECRSAHRFRLDRRRSYLWAALGRGHRIVVCSATVVAPGLGVGRDESRRRRSLSHPLYLGGMVVMALLAALMIFLPFSSAGDPERAGAANGNDVRICVARARPRPSRRGLSVLLCPSLQTLPRSRDRIASAARAAGRNAGDIALMAVSKTHPQNASAKLITPDSACSARTAFRNLQPKPRHFKICAQPNGT